REVDGDEARARIAFEVAQRHEHAVPAIIRHAQRRRIDDADESWLAATMRRVRAANGMNASHEAGVHPFDQLSPLIVQPVTRLTWFRQRRHGNRVRNAPLDIFRAVSDAFPYHDSDLVTRHHLDCSIDPEPAPRTDLDGQHPDVAADSKPPHYRIISGHGHHRG